jgi:hypothetical protein
LAGLGLGKLSDANHFPDFSSIFGLFLSPCRRPHSTVCFIIFSSASAIDKLTVSSHLGGVQRSFAARLRLDSIWNPEKKSRASYSFNPVAGRHG